MILPYQRFPVDVDDSSMEPVGNSYLVVLEIKYYQLVQLRCSPLDQIRVPRCILHIAGSDSYKYSAD